LNKHLILLRGLPGSGKSTLAQVLSEQGKYPIFCIDDYFTDSITGEYHFEFSKNYLAYKACEQHTEDAMIHNTPKIFVANTFTLAWEIEPYFKLAATYGYLVFVTTVEKYHTGKNIHDVSDEQLKKMAEKYQVKLL
jgi:predicted kinase